MELKLIIESILFTSQKPLSLREIREVLSTAAEKGEDETAKQFRKTREDDLKPILEELEKDHLASNRSYFLACVAGSWQFVGRAEFMPWLRAFHGVKNRPPRLSQPSLETLAIIAYRQPITRAEIEQIRGVAVDGVVATLLERGLIENAGRAEVIGRPMTYATTALFLEYFGLRNLEELPAAEELRRIPVEKPETLLTVEQPEAAPTAEAPVEQRPPKEGSPTLQSPEASTSGGNAAARSETRTESSAVAAVWPEAEGGQSNSGLPHSRSPR